MKTTRILLVGGFLGAGKTTLLENISQRLIDCGHKVGLITNDQAPELVDTLFLAQNGKQVAEVSGSCFCCNFDGLFGAVRQLHEETQPEVILAEPVGSCTDLSATILQPLKEQLEKIFVLSPLSVVVDARRLSDLFQGLSTGLHPDAEYIFCKQMEEADIIVVNKIDRVDAGEVSGLREQLVRNYPRASCFFLSARTGEGVQDWLDAVMQRNDCGSHTVEVDYDRYAEGEAVLGWLNATVDIEGEVTDWKVFTASLMSELGNELDQKSVAVGHVKSILVAGGAAPIIANLTGKKDTLDVRGPSVVSAVARLTINARAEMSPDELEELVRQTLDSVCGKDFTVTTLVWQSLSPGRPNPTYRYAHVIPVR